MMNKIVFMTIAALALPWATAKGSSLRIGSVVINKSSQLGIELLYYRICGAKLKGVIMRPNGPEMQLAVLQEVPTIICTGMASMETIHLPATFTRSSLKFRPINIDSFADAVSSVSLIKTSVSPINGQATKHWALEAIFPTNCRKPIGFVVSLDKTRPLSYLVEAEPAIKNRDKSNDASKCQSEKSLDSLKYLDLATLNSDYFLRSSQSKNIDFMTKTKFYKLPITSASLNLQKGNLSVKYKSWCNESPIGVLLDQKQNGKIELSMVVARLRRYGCKIGKKRVKIVSSFEAQINAQNRLLTLWLPAKSNARPELIFDSPQNFLSDKKFHTASFYSSCEKPAGIVVTSLGKNFLVGMTRFKPLMGNYVCPSPTKIISYKFAKSFANLLLVKPLILVEGSKI